MEIPANRALKPGPSDEPVFLVMERDPLIADDIMGSLSSMGPCRVILARNAGEVPKKLSGENRISAAFLDVCFETVLERGLDQTLSRYGARIILTVGEDDQARALARGWGMLLRPFSENMVRNVAVPQPLQ